MRSGEGPGTRRQAESKDVKQFVNAAHVRESEGRRPLRRARAGSEQWSKRDTVSQDWIPMIRSGSGFKPIQAKAQSTSDHL